MTTLEHASHSIRRKAYAPHYNPANLAKFQPEMHEPMLELVHVRPLVLVSLRLLIDDRVSLDDRELQWENVSGVSRPLSPAHG